LLPNLGDRDVDVLAPGPSAGEAEQAADLVAFVLL
jgi:hypothetical protein